MFFELLITNKKRFGILKTNGAFLALGELSPRQAFAKKEAHHLGSMKQF